MAENMIGTESSSCGGDIRLNLTVLVALDFRRLLT